MLQARLEIEPMAPCHRGGYVYDHIWSKLKSPRKVVRTPFLNWNDPYWILSNFGLWKFYRKILAKLVNWQLVLISRKINFEYERPRNFYFSLKLLFDFN